MNSINIPPGIVRFLVFIILFIPAFVKADVVVSDDDIKNRVYSLPSSIEVRYNDVVKSKINHLIQSNRKVSETVLGRSSIYFPLIEGIIKEKNLPQDLKYVAVVESALNPNAISRVKATGMWQFMRPTAKWIGLSVNRAVDERRDPIKSTYAAMDYLSKLYEQFDDWTLAIAAYNCGPGNVRKAIRRSGGKKNYWEIEKYLPRETRNYIPKIIAMNYMMNYYYDHDIEPIEVENARKFTASVKVFNEVKLREVAQNYNVDFTLVKELNPSFLRNFIPRAEGRHYLTLPEDKLYEFVNSTNSHEHLFHVDLLALSEQGTTKAELLAKPPVSSQMLRTTIEISPLSKNHLPNSKAVNIKKVVLYDKALLKQGQTIADLARENGVELSTIIDLNGYTDQKYPSVGEVVKIPIK